MTFFAANVSAVIGPHGGAWCNVSLSFRAVLSVVEATGMFPGFATRFLLPAAGHVLGSSRHIHARIPSH